MFVCAHHYKNTLCLSSHQHLVARVVAVEFYLGRPPHLYFSHFICGRTPIHTTVVFISEILQIFCCILENSLDIVRTELIYIYRTNVTWSNH